MNKIENLKDLLIEQGRELHSSYQQELAELPNFEKKAISSNLKKIIKKQTQITKDQQTRLTNVFGKLNANPDGNTSLTTKSILRESKDRIEHSKTGEVCDACIVNSLQQLGHKKVSDLGAIAAYAKEIGKVEAATILHQSLNEEKELGRELINLAQKDINRQAASVITA
jgi:ferritin-like metal-binding protein YciE